MPTPFEDVTFLARAGKALTGISGADITLPASTTAEGLSKNGSITIDAIGGGTTVVAVGNSGAGVANLTVDGDVIPTGNVNASGSVRGNAVISLNSVKIGGGTGFAIDLSGTPTAARTVTLQNMSGTVAMLEANPQTFTGLQSFNASANFRTGTANYYDGFGYHTFRVGMDARTVGFFNVAPVVRQGATTAVPATPALVGADTVDRAGLVAQLGALRATVEELRARLTAYGLTP